MKYVSQEFLENCSAQLSSIEKPNQFEGNSLGGAKTFEDEDDMHKDESGSRRWIDWLPKKMKDELDKKNSVPSIGNNAKPRSPELPANKFGSSVNDFYPKETIDRF